ncbi:efflux transporter outer membrane subunit [Derxia gummosa]|uniref:Efflux transporter outer membrane subunit n=1 Tax=Derxia gummosa DSM 723 TaxID=1121388 RepID=A0A8B6X853_9BURK|nr:efflux transporter outer membrane subunit [Derxia gummosa]
MRDITSLPGRAAVASGRRSRLLAASLDGAGLAPRLGALAIALTLAGCMVGPDYKRPAVNLPAGYDVSGGNPQAGSPAADSSQTGAAQAAPGSADAPLATDLPARWWTLFNDDRLTALVDSALASNASLAQAIAQIEASDALVRQANAAFFPEIGLGGTATRARSSQRGLQRQQFSGRSPVYEQFQAQLSTSFELDFWGRLRSASDAARAQLLGSRFARDVTALGLASSTATAYFTLRSIDAQTRVTQDSLKTADDSLRIVRARVQAGYTSDLDLAQAESQRAQFAASLVELARQRAVIEHQLGQLSGQPGLKIEPGTLDSLPLPQLPPPGLPSTLLERRPDVRSAEQSLMSSTSQIGVAKASLFPTFSLTGQFGGQSLIFSELLDAPARIWSAGLGVNFPLFAAGRYTALVDQAEANARAQAASYRGTVETAFREVSDALGNVQSSAQSEAEIQRQADSARRALDIARRRYDAGYSGFLEVLDAQRSYNTAANALVQSRASRLAYSVDLMKALGGGWTAEASAAAQGKEVAATAGGARN